jgi:integrase
LKLATVRRRAGAITRAHRAADHPTPLADPRVKSVLEGIARTHGAPPRKKAALDRDQLLSVTAAIDPTTTAGLRDRALLLTGFALGLRRSELVSIQVEDLKPHPDGLLVTLNRAEGDQHGEGHTFLLANGKSPEACPVTALHAWITHAQLTHGPIARRVSRSGRVLDPLTAQSIPLIIRRRLEAAALPGVNLDDYSGHSLRSGFATQAARDGYTSTQIRHVTRHKDPRTLDGYIQAGTRTKDLALVL